MLLIPQRAQIPFSESDNHKEQLCWPKVRGKNTGRALGHPLSNGIDHVSFSPHPLHNQDRHRLLVVRIEPRALADTRGRYGLKAPGSQAREETGGSSEFP